MRFEVPSRAMPGHQRWHQPVVPQDSSHDRARQSARPRWLFPGRPQLRHVYRPLYRSLYCQVAGRPGRGAAASSPRVDVLADGRIRVLTWSSTSAISPYRARCIGRCIACVLAQLLGGVPSRRVVPGPWRLVVTRAVLQVLAGHDSIGSTGARESTITQMPQQWTPICPRPRTAACPGCRMSGHGPSHDSGNVR